MTYVLFVIMYGNMTTLEYPSAEACHNAGNEVLTLSRRQDLDAYAFCVSGQKHEARK